MIINERAYARAGLLGNPSDGYFGKTISISVKNFGAWISLFETPELVIEPYDQKQNNFDSISDLIETVQKLGYYGGERLVKAAIIKFSEYCSKNGIKLENRNFTVRFRSNIPRQVGLAGSSAIITAVIKALIRFYSVKIPKEIIPTIILKSETDELGINAGLQDRVIQVYEKCVYMDFEKSHLEKNNFGKYEYLDPGKIVNNIFIAYREDLSKISGHVLNDIRERYLKGEQKVVEILNEIGGLAESGKEAIASGDLKKLGQLINRNFDLRSEIMNISEANIELVQSARKCGAPAKFSGSGGSIIGLYENDEMLTRIIIEMKKIKARVIRPFIL